MQAGVRTLVERLCASRVSDAADEGVGRIVWVTGGIGAGRTTTLTAAVEACRAAGVDARLLRAGDPTVPPVSALIDELLDAAQRGPELVAVDDADRHRGELLAGIVAAADTLRDRRVLVLVTTAEPNDGRSVPSGAASGAGLRELAAVAQRVHLAPLDRAELAAQLLDASDGDPPSTTDHVDTLLRMTGGIPRLVSAAIADARAADAPAADARAADASDPDGGTLLAAAADAMLAALDPDTLEAVACAARMEEPIDPVAISGACGEDGAAAVTRALATGTLLWDRSGALDTERPPHALSAAAAGLRFSAEALRVAASRHDEVSGAGRSLRIARALLAGGGGSVDPGAVLRHLRMAGPLAPEELLVEVGELGLAEARMRGELDGQVDALEVLRAVNRHDPDRWRALGSELATVALHVGRRDRAWSVARSVLRSFDGVGDGDLDDARRRVLVDALLAATTGQEYLSHEESEEAYELLLRTVARLGDDGHAARLICRAAEIVSIRPHASALVRTGFHQDAPVVRQVPPQGDAWERADLEAHQLLDRAEHLLGGLEHRDPALTATLDVAWARSHLHHEHAEERRSRLARSLRHLDGFDRAWAGTRLALDALAVGDRDTVRQALLDASPTTIDRSPLVAWRVGTVRAMLLLATGTPGARAACEDAARLGARAAEPMADVVALVQRSVVRVESDLTPLTEEELAVVGPDVHPLILTGRLEIRARMAAMHRRITGLDGGALGRDASALLGAIGEGRMNRGNQQLAIVLLARVLFLMRHEGVDAALVGAVAELLEPLGELVPTDTLGLVCAGSAARHLANLRALEGRHDEASLLAGRARGRDAALGLERFLLAGRIETVERRILAGDPLTDADRTELHAAAVAAERRELHLLGREARLVAHPEVHGVLDGPQLGLLEDLAQGLQFSAIADLRGYSTGTMRKMALPVYRALGVSGREEAVALGQETGLLPRTGPGYAG